MVLFKLLPLFGPLLPLLSGIIVWLLLRHRNFETRRKRGEIFLVLAPFVLAILLFLGHLIFQ